MANRKSTSTRSTPRQKQRARPQKTLTRLGAEIPASLRDFSRRMRLGLGHLEKRIEKGGRDARRRGARMLREASHRLGQLEAQGEREWRRQSLRARRASVRLLRQLERTIEPPRKAARRKQTGRKTAGGRVRTAAAGR